MERLTLVQNKILEQNVPRNSLSGIVQNKNGFIINDTLSQGTVL